MKKILISLTVLSTIMITPCISAEKEINLNFDYGFDAYYSWAEISFGKREDMKIEFKDENEIEIYKTLLKRALIPRFLMFEVSAYPMPALGALIKKHKNDFYNRASILGQNLVQAVCIGFEEPMAFTVLVGNIVYFKPKGEEVDVKGKAYMGFLASLGKYHIMDSELFDDSWMELEWKIKGERMNSIRNMKWSYRIGGKLHGNANIQDVAYFGLARGRVDRDYYGASLIRNGNIEYIVDFRVSPLKVIRHYVFVGRSFPSKNSDTIFSLDIGFLWESGQKYTNSLSRAGGDDIFQIVFRPNLYFKVGGNTMDKNVFKFKKASLEIVQGDITTQETDAIVNAANIQLAPGGGVSGAIHNTAGPMLWDECKTLGGCKTGEAKITKGYSLKANHVIHTVGPIYSGSPQDPIDLKNCYRNCLILAEENKLKSVSFPLISAGIFGYPVKEAVELAVEAIVEYMKTTNKKLKTVRVVLLNDKEYDIFTNKAKELIK